ncbi:MAG: lysophospholipid acyltransferase family protein, partial [Pirellulaceae bacterium]
TAFLGNKMAKHWFSFESSRVGRFTRKLASTGLGVAMQHVFKTTDLETAYYDTTIDPARPEYNEHCIFVFWHENLAILLPSWPNIPVTLLVSQHRDAEWLVETADFLGFNAVRGSTTRGGSAAIRQLKRQCSKSSLVLTPDGPQGPRRQMAMGPIFLASRLQMPLVPVGIGYDRPWRLNTWDRFAIPRPFSRARIVTGPKIRLPKNLGREAMEDCRIKFQTLLDELNDYADMWAASGIRVLQQKPFVRVRRTRELTFADSAPADSIPRKAA